jgi:hypothetical protein
MYCSKYAPALAGLAWLAMAALASDQPKTIEKPAPPQPAPGAVQLNETDLPQMLKELGFNVDTKQNPQKETYWLIRTQEDGWGFVVEVVPQRDKMTKQMTGFWLISDLGGVIENPGALSATALLRLMDKSHSIAPYFFSYNAATKHIAMNYEYPFNTVDKKRLKEEFKNLFTQIRDTHGLWKINALMPGTKPNPAVNPPGLAGSSWKGTEEVDGYGDLAFQFQDSGKAIMVDKDGKHPGNWTQNGNQITLQFYDGGVTYKGTLSENSLSGTGNNAATSWKFIVKRQ